MVRVSWLMVLRMLFCKRAVGDGLGSGGNGS